MINCSCEITDLFANESNYSWVKKYKFQMPENATNNQIIRKAKQLLELNGIRCKKTYYGETIELRPYCQNTVAFISVDY